MDALALRLGRQSGGRAAEVFQELDGTMAYAEFKALMLERLGCTCIKARQTVWRKSSRSIPGTGWNDGLCRSQSSNVGEAWMHLR